MNFTQRDHAIVLCYWDVLSGSINVLDNHSAFVFWEFWPPDSLTMWFIIGFWSCCITSASRKDWRLSQPFGQCEIGPKKKMLTQEKNAGYQGFRWAFLLGNKCPACGSMGRVQLAGWCLDSSWTWPCASLFGSFNVCNSFQWALWVLTADFPNMKVV